ncbi:MAG TPA: hypothetical protein VMR14_16045 [Streptosporangiaceae bacterium]|nr:hypothetical protein [Streptosporangiaceae bacterium]
MAEHQLLPLPFEAVTAWLAGLVERGVLTRVSEQAYDGQIEQLVRVGPLGAVPGASKLVRVRFVDPVYRDDVMTVGLRWEATGMAGGLFPVLDADIVVAKLDELSTSLDFTGSYRPPLGGVGTSLDKVVLHKVARASISALMRDLAASLPGRPAE